MDGGIETQEISLTWGTLSANEIKANVLAHKEKINLSSKRLWTLMPTAEYFILLSWSWVNEGILHLKRKPGATLLVCE